jgi:AraC-like DNA-binding protein
MSRYHFLRMFNIVVGMTPHQYLLQIRLHDAAVRLRQTDESISSIALDAGFDDLSTFNKRFRKITGMNPKAYRKARWSDRGTPASES